MVLEGDNLKNILEIIHGATMPKGCDWHNMNKDVAINFKMLGSYDCTIFGVFIAYCHDNQ